MPALSYTGQTEMFEMSAGCPVHRDKVQHHLMDYISSAISRGGKASFNSLQKKSGPARLEGLCSRVSVGKKRYYFATLTFL